MFRQQPVRICTKATKHCTWRFSGSRHCWRLISGALPGPARPGPARPGPARPGPARSVSNIIIVRPGPRTAQPVLSSSFILNRFRHTRSRLQQRQHSERLRDDVRLLRSLISNFLFITLCFSMRPSTCSLLRLSSIRLITIPTMHCAMRIRGLESSSVPLEMLANVSVHQNSVRLF
jgi:hypothetical protein